MLGKTDTLADTIVARATPEGEGAIAIVRLSGPRALQVGAKVAPAYVAPESHRLVMVDLYDAAGDLLDRGMKVEMHAPRSFTGENVVELHLHGSWLIVESVIRACIEQGARLAQPGEFSLRAFLNGRMDLSQAEAVADLISARSEAEQHIANAQLRGGLSRAVEGLIEGVEKIRADWQAVLDFPEQLVETDIPAHDESIDEIICNIQTIVDKACVDLSRGLRVVLCGAPNVGKSTLLNAWTGFERALVDQEPGTTRDPVEVELKDGGGRWTVCDTAGVREGAGRLESQGIAMTRQWISGADVALWLLSGEDPVLPPEDLKVIVVGSKKDLTDSQERARIEELCEERGLSMWGWISVRTGEGVRELRERIRAGWTRSERASEVVVVRQRHLDALRACLAGLSRARAVETLDLRCMEMEEASRHLGTIVGRDVDAEVLDKIFSEFCLGK